MDKCKRFKKMISDYVEGELSDNEKKQLENHIETCSNCLKIIQRIRILQNNLRNLKIIKTSSDFETVLHTRIKIESGIGRRRLHKIVWGWPARIPVYGMSLALIIIASILAIEHINKPYQSNKPDANVNTEWYGGNPNNNIESTVLDEHENVIYIIDRMSHEKLIDNKRTLSSPSNLDSVTSIEKDSLSFPNNQIKQVNQIVY